MLWNTARVMKSSASVKLLGWGSGVTSSCLAFELSIGRVTSATVVIECWHLNVLEYCRGMKRFAFVKLLGRGSGVTSSSLAFEFRGCSFCSIRCRVEGVTCVEDFPVVVGGPQERRCNLVQFFLVHDTAITSYAGDSCPFDGFWMYCYQFNSAAFPTLFLPYVTFRFYARAEHCGPWYGYQLRLAG